MPSNRSAHRRQHVVAANKQLTTSPVSIPTADVTPQIEPHISEGIVQRITTRPRKAAPAPAPAPPPAAPAPTAQAKTAQTKSAQAKAAQAKTAPTAPRRVTRAMSMKLREAGVEIESFALPPNRRTRTLVKSKPAATKSKEPAPKRAAPKKAATKAKTRSS